MRDALGNIIPGSVPVQSGTVPAPGAPLRAPAGPQLKAAGLPTNASPAASQALAGQINRAAAMQAQSAVSLGKPLAGAARPRGLGTVLR